MRVDRNLPGKQARQQQVAGAAEVFGPSHADLDVLQHGGDEVIKLVNQRRRWNNDFKIGKQARSKTATRTAIRNLPKLTITARQIKEEEIIGYLFRVGR